MISQILFTIYLGISVIGIAIVALTRVKRQNIDQKLHSRPSVSIIIPTRNEEKNIGRCLQSLKSLDYPDYEILVVDGHSEDRTQDIVREFENVTLIVEPTMPTGWVGKPWACHVGQQHAKGEVLLFTDADTTHNKNSLFIMVSHLQASRGFVSLLTTQQFRTFWEHVLTIFFLAITIAVGGTEGNSRSQIANGQYMMFTRETYDTLGGHQSVHDSIIEDLAFGTHAARQGIPPQIIDNKHLVYVRMYDNLSGIFEGFSKNMALGVKQVGFVNITKTFFVLLWPLFGFMVLPFTNIVGDIYHSYVIALFVMNYLLFTLLFFMIEREIAEKGTLYGLFYPIFMITFLAIVSKSLYNTVFRKRIIWKNREYTITN